MPDHVALIHDGRVLVDASGSLPELPAIAPGGDRSLAATLAQVGAEIPIAPTVRLDDGRRVELVGMRDRTPAGDLAAADALTDPALAAAVARAVTELDPSHAPAGRPDWFRPGWFDLIEAWIDAALGPTGRRRTGPVEPFRLWSVSAVVRVPTDDGTLWCKAPCAHFRAEARIHTAVARLLPGLVPALVATEPHEGWLLMEPMTGAAEHEQAPGAALQAAARWAEAQLSSIDHVASLERAGLERRGAAATVGAFQRLLSDSAELQLLSEESLTAARAAAPRALELVRELWDAGIPDTLSHGDLHLGNIAWDGSTLTIFDWTDGCITHPFLDASHLIRFDDPAGGGAVLAAYAEPWRAAFPGVDIDRMLALAPLADLVFQTVTFDEIAKATEAQSAWELGGVVARKLRELPGALAAVG